MILEGPGVGVERIWKAVASRLRARGLELLFRV